MSARRPTRQIEARRTRLAEMLLEHPGRGVRWYARELRCAHGTVARDIAAIRQEWAERRTELYESRAAEDLVRTDQAMEAIWTRVHEGDTAAIGSLVSLLHYRAKVLGLDIQRQEHDIGQVLAGYLARMYGDGSADT